jgi:hypothetical protein
MARAVKKPGATIEPCLRSHPAAAKTRVYCRGSNRRFDDMAGFYFLNSFFARSRSLQAQLMVRRASRAFPVRI